MIKYLPLALIAVLVQSAHADVLCVKNSQRISVSRSRVNVRLPSLITTATSTCPSGYTQVTPYVKQETTRTSFTGLWNLSSTRGGIYADATISFPERLNAAPTQTIFVEAGTTNPTCTGTVSNPTAPAGVLCIYESYGSNMRGNFTFRYFMYSGIGDISESSSNASTLGGAMYGYSEDTTTGFYAWGSWAVSQP
jgi:hypothetical protein